MGMGSPWGLRDDLEEGGGKDEQHKHGRAEPNHRRVAAGGCLDRLTAS